MSEKTKSYKSIQLLIFFNLLLAFVAFIKDIVLASYFGTSEVADSINLALFLPDTIGNNLVGAAIAVAIIPVLTRLTLKDEFYKSLQVIQRISILLLALSLALFLVVVLFNEPFLRLFSIHNKEQITLVGDYFWIMAPIIFIAPLWLMGSSILQASRKFIVPAITPIIFNGFLLISLIVCQFLNIPQSIGGKTFSVVITFSTLFVFLFTWFFVLKDYKNVWKYKYSKHYSKHTRDLKEIRKIGATFLAYLFILLFSQIALFFERMFASTLETGTVAALTYAFRISQFPIWVFIAAVNTFILPTISLHLEKKDITALKNDLWKSFLFVIGISGSVSLLLVTFSEPILHILLGRGSFTNESVELTSSILKSYGLSIVGQSLYVFCMRYYVAEGKMKTPLYLGLLACVLNIVLLYFFVPNVGAVGIGYAVTVSSTISGVLLLIHFTRDVLRVGQKGVDWLE
ncbi:MAG: murJ 2 [Bacillales bacterium]|nr:murJ 2 [Bacillales bacterium]